jgi:hypothetical protein
MHVDLIHFHEVRLRIRTPQTYQKLTNPVHLSNHCVASMVTFTDSRGERLGELAGRTGIVLVSRLPVDDSSCDGINRSNGSE